MLPNRTIRFWTGRVQTHTHMHTQITANNFEFRILITLIVGQGIAISIGQFWSAEKETGLQYLSGHVQNLCSLELNYTPGLREHHYTQNPF